jgi:hypothetical protein
MAKQYINKAEELMHSDIEEGDVEIGEYHSSNR